MKQRLLVMNGQRIVQAEQGGAWTNEKVDKAGALKPGMSADIIAVAGDPTANISLLRDVRFVMAQGNVAKH